MASLYSSGPAVVTVVGKDAGSVVPDPNEETGTIYPICLIVTGNCGNVFSQRH